MDGWMNKRFHAWFTVGCEYLLCAMLSVSFAAFFFYDSLAGISIVGSKEPLVSCSSSWLEMYVFVQTYLTL